MAKIWGGQFIQSVRSWEELRRFTAQCLTSIADALTGGLTFADNVFCQIVTIGPAGTYAWNGGAVTTIPHNLGVIPSGFLILNKNGAGTVYMSPSFAPTTGNVYLVTTDAGATYTIAILG